MPFSMGFRQICDEIPAFRIYPLIDGFVVGRPSRVADGESARDFFRRPAVIDQMGFHVRADDGVCRASSGMAAAGT